MAEPVLTKSDFLEYRRCAKALWLRKHKPDAVAWSTPSQFDQLLMQDGYAVEAMAKELVGTWSDADSCNFQVAFKSPDRLYALADLVRSIGDKEIDIFEIKASTSLRSSNGDDHVDDAAFQTLVVERCGLSVGTVSVIHVNKEFVRNGPIDSSGFLTIVDVTEEVRERLAEIAAEADAALDLLREEKIDENGCTCRFIGNRKKQCDAFDYFNPGIPEESIYLLPSISRKKLETFWEEDRLALSNIEESELSPTQGPVLRSAKAGTPIINHAAIEAFLNALEWPLHFYDYETFASAIPPINGGKPHSAIPNQFSHHLLRQYGDLQHFEYLCDAHDQHEALVEAMEASFEPQGSVVSWNKSFEMKCNETLAELLPQRADFLNTVNVRTVDLMALFKKDYVDIRFEGSTSIKKVLPVLCLHLQYDTTAVHDGGGAMAA